MQALAPVVKLAQVSNKAWFYSDRSLFMGFYASNWTQEETDDYRATASRLYGAEPITKITGVFHARMPYVVMPVDCFWNKMRVIVMHAIQLQEMPLLPPNIQTLRIQQCAINTKLVLTGKQLGAVQNFILNDFDGALTLHVCDSKLETIDITLKQGYGWDRLAFVSFPTTLNTLRLRSLGASISLNVLECLAAAKRGVNGGRARVELLGCDIHTQHNAIKKNIVPERVNALMHPYIEVQSDRRSLSAREIARDYLAKRLIGQPFAVEAGADLLLQAWGNSTKKGPKAIALFFGPTGVGKTELAKLCASFLSERHELKPYHFHRIDMAEYAQAHSESKLLGMTVGYVGFAKTETLVDVLEKNPRTILLLDEFEKAEKSVQQLFLGMMDDGSLQDGKGKKANCSQVVLIITSNVCAQELARFDWSQDGSVTQALQMVREVLSSRISPEFVGRVTTMVPFCSLNREQIMRVVELQVADFCSQAPRTHNICKLIVSRDVWLPLVEQASTEYGARLVAREVLQQIRVALTNALASGFIDEGEAVLMKRNSNNQVRCYVAS